MFTGIVQAVGTLERRDARADGFRATIDTATLPLDGVAIGDSIAVNGVCLTVAALAGARFEADVSGATLAATTLGALPDGAPVNLERALTLATPLGGHLVSGHVDGVGEVVAFDPVGDSRSLRVRVPTELKRYIARKGSVCVDGVSLTVNEVAGDEFSVNLVAHTLAHSTLGAARVGDKVNVEVDLLARYLERLIERN